MQKKLLIGGGSYADIPLIKSAKKMGFYVITSGNRPEDLGHKESDEYWMEDFSKPEAMLNLTKKLNIDAICSCCNDFSAISSAYVAEHLGLPGHDSYETTKLIHHKDRYRKFALSNNIPTPKAKSFSDIKLALSYIENCESPIIIKPVDLTGGKGISKLDNSSLAKLALQKAFSVSKSKRIVVEDFLTGSRHGFSAFLRNGKVTFFFSDNEHYFKNPYLVSAASAPSVVPKSVENELCLISEKIANLLSLKDGIFHIQYILTESGPIIIEICRRAPGDLYIKLVEYATGVKYSDWIVKSSVGLDCGELSHTKTTGFFTRHCIMTNRSGRIKNIVFDISIKKNIINQFIWWREGDYISDPMTSKCGIVFLKFDSMDEMLTKTEKMQELIHVELVSN